MAILRFAVEKSMRPVLQKAIRSPLGGVPISEGKGTIDREKVPFRFIDLFSSVGGLSLGAVEAITSLGMRPLPLLAADTDRRALQVYKANYRPRTTRTESVRRMVDFRVNGSGEGARFAYAPTITDSTVASFEGLVDLVLAGPPCQGHSSLNNHSRHEDPKNLLYLAVPAFAVALGAKHIVIENVPNIVADRHGVVETTISLLRSSGFIVRSGVLAADKLGWPQTRKRFFLVASRDSQPRNLKYLAELNARGDPLPVKSVLHDLESVELDEADIMRSVPRLSSENQRRIEWLFDNRAYDLPNEARPDCHKLGTTYTATYGRMHEDAPAPTITGGFLSPGRGRFIHPTARRVLTPRSSPNTGVSRLVRLHAESWRTTFKRRARALDWQCRALNPGVRRDARRHQRGTGPSNGSHVMSIRFTRPEIAMMEALSDLAFEVQDHNLPGTPDIVFHKEQLAVFVHGCYWHRHFDCPIARTPRKNNLEWLRHFAKKVRRDQEVVALLRSRGWWVHIAWECEIIDAPEVVSQGIRESLKRRTTHQ